MQIYKILSVCRWVTSTPHSCIFSGQFWKIQLLCNLQNGILVNTHYFRCLILYPPRPNLCSSWSSYPHFRNNLLKYIFKMKEVTFGQLFKITIICYRLLFFLEMGMSSMRESLLHVSQYKSSTLEMSWNKTNLRSFRKGKLSYMFKILW